MEVTKRIQKLETDLNLITSIRDILMLNRNEDNSTIIPNDHVLRLNLDEHPVRDANNRNTTTNSLTKQNQHQEAFLTARGTRNDFPKTQKSTKLLSQCKCQFQLQHCQKTEAVAVNNVQAVKVDDELEIFRKEISQERQKRKEIEESSQTVVIQLQKVEDDLKREKEVKHNLLVGTLQMKNQLQGYYTQISELEKQIETLQTENKELAAKISYAQTANANKVEIYLAQIKNLEDEVHTLIQNKLEMEKVNDALKKNCSQLTFESERMKENFNMDKKLLQQNLNKLIAKCTHFEKTKKEVEKDLQSTLHKGETFQEKSKTAQLQLKLLQQISRKQQNDKNEQIKSLQLVLKQERDKLSQQMDAATNLLSRTTTFITSLKNQTQNKNNLIQKYSLSIQQFQRENKNLQEEIEGLRKEILHQSNFKERFWSSHQQHLEEIRKLKEEQEKLQNNLRERISSSEELQRNQEKLMSEFAKEKSKWEEQTAAKDHEAKILQDELKRTTDNLQILRKISEDQGKTITKQRNDLESSSNVQHKLQVQLRESQETEKALSVALCEEERSKGELQLELSHLEHQLSIMNKEVKEHNCEEFVESKFLQKVKDLEEKVTKLERSVKLKEEEKDKALTAARKALRQAEELKEICDSKIAHTKNSMSQKFLKIQEEKRQLVIESNAKIRESQSENLSLKEAFGQMQNTYMAKIHQLQTALATCISPAQNNFGFGSGMHHSNVPNFSGFGAANFSGQGLYNNAI